MEGLRIMRYPLKTKQVKIPQVTVREELEIRANVVRVWHEGRKKTIVSVEQATGRRAAVPGASRDGGTKEPREAPVNVRIRDGKISFSYPDGFDLIRTQVGGGGGGGTRWEYKCVKKMN